MMGDFRLHKVQVQVICTEHDDDGDVLAEHSIAQGEIFAKRLDEIPGFVREAVEKFGEQRTEAKPKPNRKARRAAPKAKASTNGAGA